MSDSATSQDSYELAHEPDANRYTLRDGKQILSVLDYQESGDRISFTRTFTNPARRGEGHAARVTEFAVNDVEKRGGLKIVPMCWYVGEWFDQHPERAALLAD